MIVSGANLENEINIKADWLNEINQITFVKRGDSILQKSSSCSKLGTQSSAL